MARAPAPFPSGLRPFQRLHKKDLAIVDQQEYCWPASTPLEDLLRRASRGLRLFAQRCLVSPEQPDRPVSASSKENKGFAIMRAQYASCLQSPRLKSCCRIRAVSQHIPVIRDVFVPYCITRDQPNIAPGHGVRPPAQAVFSNRSTPMPRANLNIGLRPENRQGHEA
jgi:hypothetical protein